MKIYYSNPYSQEKKIGKALNEFCSIVPNDDDWIVLQDGDILYLTPTWGKLIYESLKFNGDQFGLIGCYTNRLRGLHQLHNNEISNDHEIRYHFGIAKEYELRESKVNDINGLGVAGLFMAFKKSTWKQVNGFDEESIAFDTIFNQKVKALGYKTGLINNLYIYHGYRLWNDINPQDDTTHLI
jgi:cellulose synthase/poly-beta-1,6-N-acetylglucosamine synthase-like glycosyltransferase